MITQDQLDAAEEAFGVEGQHIDIHKLDPTHKKILLICEDFPEAVNDRPLLMAKFYESDWDLGKSLYDNFKRLIRPETVVRRFRDLRAWGYVKQSEKADKYNYDAMISERDRHSPIPPQVDHFVEDGTVEYDKTGRARTPTVKIVKGEKVVTWFDEMRQEVTGKLDKLKIREQPELF